MRQFGKQLGVFEPIGQSALLDDGNLTTILYMRNLSLLQIAVHINNNGNARFLSPRLIFLSVLHNSCILRDSTFGRSKELLSPAPSVSATKTAPIPVSLASVYITKRRSVTG